MAMTRASVAVTGALVVSAAGAALWTAGTWQQHGVTARRQLLTLEYGAPLGSYDEIERETAYAARIPWVSSLREATRVQRAEATYWQGEYGALVSGQKTATEHERAEILLVAANAAFRQLTLDGSDKAAPERLTAVVGQYAEVLKRDPTLLDAAFNYELAVRTRDGLARSRAKVGATKDTSDAGRGAKHAGEGDDAQASAPPAQTIHGRTGKPPLNPDMNEFKIIVPQRPEERQQRPEAGAGGAKVRKG